ncbi:uncharacterized protein LOC143219482 [Lasioglossum baleicum]|uniref:uncharacterized protein LOC143219482 n=1 Tax=Lasioglossum baleicum TaxID=434251 RepID=UPI003FCD49B9
MEDIEEPQQIRRSRVAVRQQIEGLKEELGYLQHLVNLLSPGVAHVEALETLSLVEWRWNGVKERTKQLCTLVHTPPELLTEEESEEASTSGDAETVVQQPTGGRVSAREEAEPPVTPREGAIPEQATAEATPPRKEEVARPPKRETEATTEEERKETPQRKQKAAAFQPASDKASAAAKTSGPVDKNRQQRTASWGQYEKWMAKERFQLKDPDACWNCGKYGHDRNKCPQNIKTHCFRCGRSGCSVRTCPICGSSWRKAQLKQDGNTGASHQRPSRGA